MGAQLDTADSRLQARLTTVDRLSERFEKGDQVALFLIGESDPETRVVEGYQVFEIRRRAVVKVWRSGCQISQNGPLCLADVGALTADECLSGVCYPKRCPRQWARIAAERENGKTGSVQSISRRDDNADVTHQSAIKTTFLLYSAGSSARTAA
jgi:hypothetical protein